MSFVVLNFELTSVSFNFTDMKSSDKQVKVIASKGDRLKWPSLKEAKSVKLTAELTKGKQLTFEDLEKHIQSDSVSPRILVP